MAGLPRLGGPEVVVGTETGDDAGVYRVRDDLAVVVTADFITPVMDDPFVFGQVAAANSLSDIYAMGGRPVGVLNLCAFPKQLDLAVAREILEGGQQKVAEAGAAVLGGHTVRNEQLLYGLAVTGVIHPERVVRNRGARAGDALVLTKPIGTGLVIGGRRKGLVTEARMREAAVLMATLNARAAEVLARFAPRAMTDVTGFGLAGLALGLARARGVGRRSHKARVPIYAEAPALARQGVTTSATCPNQDNARSDLRLAEGISPDLATLLYDPQTSGGLLAAIPGESAEPCVRALNEAGVTDAALIGEVVSSAKPILDVLAD
jgi:selenide,water dikinase